MNRLGFGKYSDDQEEWPVDYHSQHANDMLAFLDALNITRCATISWCDGANITLIAASRRPSLFAAIVASVPHLKIDTSPKAMEYSIKGMIKFPELIKNNETVCNIIYKKGFHLTIN